MHADLVAVILCGGRGERLLPLTATLPKALVPVGDRPLLQHLIEHLECEGVSQFALCTGHLSKQVEAFASSIASSRRVIHVIDSGDVPMADRILDARPFTKGPVLVCYGDTLANVEVRTLYERHVAAGTGATVTVHPFVSPFGLVDCGDDGRVHAFREKPVLPFWVNIGFLVLEPRVLDLLQRGDDLNVLLSSLAAAGDLGWYRHTGRHITVNSRKELADAEREITFFHA